MLNLATQYLARHGETLADYDGLCGELADQVATRKRDRIVYIEGDIGWKYHMVMMRNGIVHDAWCEAGPLPLRDWLVNMFGEHVWIELTIDAKDVFAGHVRDFQVDDNV